VQRVELDAFPPLTELESEAICIAFVRAGLRLDAPPDGYTSAWRRAGMSESTDDEAEAPPLTDLYTPSPRSTLGATRA
jgi:hypothetical protein